MYRRLAVVWLGVDFCNVFDIMEVSRETSGD